MPIAGVLSPRLIVGPAPAPELIAGMAAALAASKVDMRILITTNPGAGHVGGIAPFARAFMRAGEAVLVAAPASARDAVIRAGLPFHPLGDPPREQLDAVFAALPGLPDEQQGVRVMREVFAGLRARASLPGLLRLMTDQRPDVVLRETTEYAGLLAAERLGVRHARIGIMGAATESWGMPIVAPVLDRQRKRLGLRPDPESRRIDASPYLTVIPEAMEDAGDARHALRFREPAPRPWALPDWWSGDARPLVYGSYGSVAPTLPSFPPLFRATVEALGELPARVLFTVGTEVELESLGPVPASVRVKRWIPQEAVMPHVAAMVGHGGSGTTRAALAAGVPSVVVPGFADQFRNAERVAALGAGIALGADEVGRVGDAVSRLLSEPSYAAAARRVAVEVAALPPVDDAPAALCDRLEIRRAA